MSEDDSLMLHKKLYAPMGYYPYAPIFSPYPYYYSEYDVKVLKPNGIFNQYMLLGVVMAGAAALVFGAGVAAFATSIVLGGLGMGIAGESIMQNNYNTALSQKREREAAERKKPPQASIESYKNIPDLPEIPEHEAVRAKRSGRIVPTRAELQDPNSAVNQELAHHQNQLQQQIQMGMTAYDGIS